MKATAPPRRRQPPWVHCYHDGDHDDGDGGDHHDDGDDGGGDHAAWLVNLNPASCLFADHSRAKSNVKFSFGNWLDPDMLALDSWILILKISNISPAIDFNICHFFAVVIF